MTENGEEDDEDEDRAFEEALALNFEASDRYRVTVQHPRPPTGRREVSVGNVKATVVPPKSVENVPFLPMSRGLPFPIESLGALEILRWMLQKMRLRQDMFLIGEAGPELRHLVFLFCTLTGRELEYLSITRDTSESDLKQRRELKNGTLQYQDQAPVRAARKGRVLLLEGIEKAERNVLPTLNNLLENREMSLEDGNFLVAPGRLGETELLEGEAKGLIPVHENFLVIAAGNPARGAPLDPPLRSRFVGFDVPPGFLRYAPKEELQLLSGLCAGSLDPPFEAMKDLVEVHKLLSAAQQRGRLQGLSATLEIPWSLPDVALGGLTRLLLVLKGMPLEGVLPRAYPVHLLPGGPKSAQCLSAQAILTNVGLSKKLFEPRGAAAEPYGDVWRLTPAKSPGRTMLVEFHGGGAPGASRSLHAPCGAAIDASILALEGEDPPLKRHFPSGRLTAFQRVLVCKALQDHAVGLDVCFVGGRGAGKTFLVETLCKLLGYQQHTIFCYQDMGARELLQRRSTDHRGDTIWVKSPLLEAAVAGEVAVLDGIDRLPQGVLYSTLARLIHDREADLPDGSRLVSAAHYERLLEEDGVTEEGLEARGISRVHPSFRIFATAAKPGQKASEAWLSPEVMSLFHFHEVPPLPTPEVISMCFPDDRTSTQKCKNALTVLVEFSKRLASSAESTESEGDLTPLVLSLRQLKRAGAALAESKGDLQEAFKRCCSVHSHFLPQSAKEKVDRIFRETLSSCKGLDGEMKQLQTLFDQEPAPHSSNNYNSDMINDKNSTLWSMQVDDDFVKIGDVKCRRRIAGDPALVPSVHFVDTQKHLQTLREMLLDWSLGYHMLLVGNQGTGKNKATDRLLELLRCEREYIQLHRDTTVQSLLLSQSLEAGVLTSQDSPLVRAAREGRCLVVDEADKAPREVVCILKAIVDQGDVWLGDGRCLSRHPNNRPHAVQVHKDFRLVVLANRPGGLFLGNDFFGACGDVFSCHVIDNPDLQSQMELLRSVAPDVNEDDLMLLCELFEDLRNASQTSDGALEYPYSLRELVKVAKHLQKFPKTPMEAALSDIFSFDFQCRETKLALMKVLKRHGLATTEQTRAYVQGLAFPPV